MVNSETVIERRFHQRFQVQQGVYALLKNGSSKLGQIKTAVVDRWRLDAPNHPANPG